LERELDFLTATRVAPGAPGRVVIPGRPEAAEERRAAERGVVIDRVHLESLRGLAGRLETPLPESTPLAAVATGAP
jgi:LDH2 family malate/lactate/ureidoglycolate dehydrogenase